MSPVFASLFPIAFADTLWNPNLNPTWTTGSATLSANILGGSITQTGGDVSSTDLIEIGGPSFGGLYTLGGGTFNVGGIWVGRIGDPPSQFVQNAGTATLSLLEITDGNGKYILNGGTLTVNHINFDYPGAGIGPGGSFVLNGGTLVTSTIALGFGSGYVGRFYFNGGTLKADPAIASSSLGWIQSGSGTNSQISIYVGQNGGQFDTNGTDRVIYSPLLHDPAAPATDGGITKLGVGTLTLVGDNTYTGVSTISVGTLQIGNGGTTGSILGNVTNNATLVFNRGDAWTYNGVISGTGNLVKTGGGALTLSGFNTFTGGTTVNAGTLKLTAGGGIGTIRGALTINPGTTVESDAIDAFGYATGQKVDSIVVNGGTIIQTAAGNLGWGVAYTLSNGALLTSNGGVSDATALSAFAFGGPIGGNTSVNVTAGVNTIAGHVDLRGDSDSLTIVNTNVNFTVASGATLNVTAGISAHNANNGAPVGLTKLGAGLMTFTGANTYTGPTIISAGTLQIGDGVTMGSLTSNITNNAALVFNQPAGTSTYAGVISGTGSLTKTGPGNLYLTGTSTYTGGTTVNGGIITLHGAVTITGLIGTGGSGSSAPNQITINSGNINLETDYALAGTSPALYTTLRINQGGLLSTVNNVTKLPATTLDGGRIDTASAGNSTTGNYIFTNGLLTAGTGKTSLITGGYIALPTAVTVAPADTLRIDSIILGPDRLTKYGTGTLVLTAANTYAGGTFLNEGTLQIGNGGASGSVTGNITDNAALVFNRTDAFTYSGIISGTGSLTQAGTGALTLSSNQTYTGPTTLTGGTLRVNGALASTAVSIQGGATLGGTGTLASVASVHIGGHIAPGSSSGNSTGTLTFAGGITFDSGAALDLQLGTASDLVRVSGGALTGPATGALTLNIFDSGGFGTGTYPLFNYSGATLASFDATDLSIGTAPAGFDYAFATNGSELDLIVTVPEPAPASMFLLCAGTLGLTRRRKGR